MQEATGHRPEELPVRFFRALDHAAYDDLLALLAPGCTWLRQGVLLEGKEAIHRAMLDRPATFVVRHLTSPAVIDIRDDGALDIQVVMAAYAGTMAKRDALPLAAEPPRQIADYSFLACREGEGWRISAISALTVFKS